MMPPCGYGDDVRLATWAWLIDRAGPDFEGTHKGLDDITEADMDSWWDYFSHD